MTGRQCAGLSEEPLFGILHFIPAIMIGVNPMVALPRAHSNQSGSGELLFRFSRLEIVS
jgi:hypothetical protein